tara:strand:+ start:646 stop:885 length:240 start_codon:yes stop_codon:yes gene_type:complete
MFEKSIIRQHKPLYAICLFIVLFVTFHYVKPSFAYGRDGEFRQFGVGYRNNTVLPVWIISIVLAILSYLAVLWYISKGT